tara:strand:+ start:123 stop:779 length:657 start_codon:yes stop_codon:yes gene_type:complete
MIRLFVYLFLTILLSGCKIDFNGDLFTADLIEVAKTGKSVNLPMEIRFQVSSCDEDLTAFSNKISTFFIGYKQIECGTGDDFMSYITSNISVPVVNNKKEFEDQNKSLIGYWSGIFENRNKPDVFLIMNLDKLSSLSDFVEKETFQKLSLEEGKFEINLINDIDDAKISIYSSRVDGQPIVFETTFELKKRDKITIESSNITSGHLEKYGWAPLFYFE